MKYMLAVGINGVEEKRLGWAGVCVGADKDPQSWSNIFDGATTLLVNEKAELWNICDELLRLGRMVKEGDELFIFFSGHGTKRSDLLRAGKDYIESDGYDEILCVFDNYLYGDQLEAFLRRFPKGVRVAVILDCCFSDGMLSVKMNDIKAEVHFFAAAREDVVALGGDDGGRFTMAMTSFLKERDLPLTINNLRYAFPMVAKNLTPVPVYRNNIPADEFYSFVSEPETGKETGFVALMKRWVQACQHVFWTAGKLL